MLYNHVITRFQEEDVLLKEKPMLTPECHVTKKIITTLGHKRYLVKGVRREIRQDSNQLLFVIYDTYNQDKSRYLRTNIYGDYSRLVNLKKGQVINVDATIIKLTVTKTYTVTPHDNEKIIKLKKSKKPKPKEYYEIKMVILDKSYTKDNVHLETTMKDRINPKLVESMIKIPNGGFIYTIER